MKNRKQWLIIEQLDQKLAKINKLNELSIPNEGWIYTIRTALRMSLRQLGKKMNMTPQSVRDIEQREKQKTVSIKTLSEAALALNMKLVYVFLPQNESLEQLIEKKAKQIAQEIVLRTANTMRLEDQENSEIRLNKAIQEKMEDLKYTLPRYLWD